MLEDGHIVVVEEVADVELAFDVDTTTAVKRCVDDDDDQDAVRVGVGVRRAGGGQRNG